MATLREEAVRISKEKARQPFQDLILEAAEEGRDFCYYVNDKGIPKDIEQWLISEGIQIKRETYENFRLSWEGHSSDDDEN